MIVANRSNIQSRTFPARRTSTNVVGGLSPVQAGGFSMGHVVLEGNGGQVPWHNHEQEEVYYILSGQGEMCVDAEATRVSAGDVVLIQSNAFHQLTNIAETELEFIYCYAPVGNVLHWQQELDGTLPQAGFGAPPLPKEACPQFTDRNEARPED